MEKTESGMGMSPCSALPSRLTLRSPPNPLVLGAQHEMRGLAHESLRAPPAPKLPRSLRAQAPLQILHGQVGSFQEADDTCSESVPFPASCPSPGLGCSTSPLFWPGTQPSQSSRQTIDVPFSMRSYCHTVVHSHRCSMTRREELPAGLRLPPGHAQVWARRGLLL